MKLRKSLKRRTIGALVACCLIVAPGMLVTTTAITGCDAGAGFLGLQDYQRDLLFGLGSLALSLLGGNEPGPGQDITPGCTIEENDDGSSTITCIQVNADGSTTSTSVTVRSGVSGTCTVADVPAGAAITCSDGTSVTVNDGDDGTDGTCSVTDNPDGSATITCTDGTSATIPAGDDGEDGSNGRNGDECELDESATQVCITCGNDEVCIDKNGGGPLFGNLFIDAFYTATGGSIAAARQADSFNPVDIFEPSLGDCGVETVAFKMGVPQRYDLAHRGNPITMRMFLYRSGPADGDCMILRLDAFLATRNARVITLGGGPRFIKLDTSDLDDGEGLLVVDLPLNKGNNLDRSLGFLTPGAANLLAFEINVLDSDRFNDGGCYTMLGVDFFESDADDETVTVSGVTEVTKSADEIATCGDCESEYFDDGDTEDLSTYGFEESGADADDVAVVAGMLQLRDDGDPNDDPGTPQTEAQAIRRDIDVSDFADATLTFKWLSLGANFATDKFYVQWRDCADDTPIPTDAEIGDAFVNAFNTLFSTSLNAGPLFPDSDIVSIPLPQAALDAGCIDLRLLTVVSQANEGALVDFIEVCGTPEPEERWACGEGDCFLDESGAFSSLEDCLSECSPPAPRFNCVDNACVEAEDGEYDLELDCLEECKTTGWACVVPAGGDANGTCVEDPQGPFSTEEQCKAECVGIDTEPRFSCESNRSGSGGWCVLDAQGPYTAEDCANEVCGSHPDELTAEPTDPQ